MDNGGALVKEQRTFRERGTDDGTNGWVKVEVERDVSAPSTPTCSKVKRSILARGTGLSPTSDRGKVGG